MAELGVDSANSGDSPWGRRRHGLGPATAGLGVAGGSGGSSPGSRRRRHGLGSEAVGLGVVDGDGGDRD
jgi:hypothetical protein